MTDTTQEKSTQSRRLFLTLGVGVVGAVGAAGGAVPFVSMMLPSARAQAAGAPVEVDLSKMEKGEKITVEWRGKPVWIVRRTDKNLHDLESLVDKLADPKSEVESQQPSYTQNIYRTIEGKEEYAVIVGICTHLGCSPTYRPDVAPADLGPEWKGGFFCPCHGSRFDLSGRVYKSVPAPTNLVIPPYQYLTDTTILIGVDHGEAA